MVAGLIEAAAAKHRPMCGGTREIAIYAEEVEMTNTIKQFDYVLVEMKKSDQLPFKPTAVIVLDHFITYEEKTSLPAVSPDLISESEIDGYIQELKDDLDAVGRRAKRALRRANETTDEIVRGRMSN